MLGTGDSFGKYRIVRLLGRGGMGVVYLAEDESLGRRVALKVLDPGIVGNDGFEERFRQEARVVASLNHPHIVRIHALERIAGATTIDMAYAEGGSLSQALEAGRVPAGWVVRVVRQSLSALACCHGAGIVHRDVKPSNILLDEQGGALLADFGLARLKEERLRKSFRSATSSGFFMGTPQYAPPEAWVSAPATPAWDVYSVGIVLFEALAGQSPYTAESPFAFIKEMSERPVPSLSEVARQVSPELSDAVAAMVARNAADRPPDAAAALDLLSGVPEADSGDVPTVLMPRRRSRQTVLRQGLRLRPRPRWLWGMLGAAMLVAAVAVALLTHDTGSAAYAREAFFDSVDPATREVRPNHWLAWPDAQGGRVMVATEPTGLWYLRQADPGAPERLEGFWAEYGDASAQVFRYGRLSATLGPLPPHGDAAASLEFRSEQDGSSSRRTFVLHPAALPTSVADFRHGIEASECLPALLYNEVLARRPEWTEAAEDVLVRLGARRVRVRPETGEPFRIDGRLDEAAWHAGGWDEPDAADWLAASSSAATSAIAFRRNAEGLVIGLRSKARLAEPRLRIVLMPRVTVPLEHSPRWTVRVNGQGVLSHDYVEREQAVPHEAHWTGSVAARDEGVEAEVFIPYADVCEGAAPAPAARWRINVSLVDSRRPNAAPAGRWGAEDIEQAEDGVILAFVGTQ